MGGVILVVGIVILGVTFLIGFQSGSGSVPTVGLAIGCFLTFMGLRSVQGGKKDEAETPDAESQKLETCTVDDTSEESECLECGALIAVGTSKCRSCGWSYGS